MKNEVWDVVVIGGGPAGMMTAGRAAEMLASSASEAGAKKGAKVLLLEKNSGLGKKLLITGGGRCNVTNAEFDNRKLLEKFKGNGKFLFSAFSKWSVKETLDFFNARGMDTKVEAGQRVFPTSNSAQSVWNVLVEYMKQGGVTVQSGAEVAGIVAEGQNVTGVKLAGSDDVVMAKMVVVATGGTSRPETGSTGDGYAWLKKIGHTVIEPTPSLVPVAIKENWISKLAGVTLDQVKITTYQNGQKQDSKKGKILFTHVGVSGPTILNMSKDIGELLKYDDVTISLDLLPTHDYSTLNTLLQETFKIHHNKKLKNALPDIIPTALASVIIEKSKIDDETPCNSITREERLVLVKILKDLPMLVDKLLGTEKAIITSGGVSLDEVDFKTMQSRLFPNLYIVGDMLNIDRPSGGYSLQLCWTTGFVAGSSISDALM